MKWFYHLFPKDLKISVYGRGWWFYTILTILGLFILTIFGNRLPDVNSRLKLVLILSIIEYIVLRLYKFSLRNIRTDYNYFNELPCYLCNQSTILCIIAAYFNCKEIMVFVIIIGTLGALLAWFFPDSYNRDQPFYSIQALGFYGYHGLLIITCLSFYTLHIYKPDPKDCLWVMFMIFILAIIAHIINVILIKTKLNPRSNYVYTVKPEVAFLKKLWSFIPHQLIYLLPIMFIFGAFSFLLLLIM